MGLLYNHAGYLAIAAIYAIAILHCQLKTMYVCADEGQEAIRIISNPAWLRSLTLAKAYVVCLYKSSAARARPFVTACSFRPTSGVCQLYIGLCIIAHSG